MDHSNMARKIDEPHSKRLDAIRRRDEPDKTLLSMHELLCDARNAFLPDAAPAGFAIRRSCAAEKCRALAESAPFRQALANLIHDADQAMPVNVAGQLLIATNNPNDKTISVDVADRGVDCRTPWMKAVSNYSSRPR
ncbi:hypothetical protein OGR47_14885 [Methylocystis sp. MJC1]|uniref:hypothetical protein n=1 Tax=Methylocystis sp. MJC1 TaxID=2654282 RepID=UPI0013EC05EE|nr:hypothetical protein [Methylocystis sp. MJC1]MBU6528248.1 hypothetical protein [Methylocystis sp. MJC1]UZX11155.1 hypothetical protein OGR47_14885 [Methylocystis sp. MJC1]